MADTLYSKLATVCPTCGSSVWDHEEVDCGSRSLSYQYTPRMPECVRELLESNESEWVQPNKLLTDKVREFYGEGK